MHLNSALFPHVYFRVQFTCAVLYERQGPDPSPEARGITSVAAKVARSTWCSPVDSTPRRVGSFIQSDLAGFSIAHTVPKRSVTVTSNLVVRWSIQTHAGHKSVQWCSTVHTV